MSLVMRLLGGSATGGIMAAAMWGLAANDVRLLMKAYNEMSKEANIKR